MVDSAKRGRKGVREEHTSSRADRQTPAKKKPSTTSVDAAGDRPASSVGIIDRHHRPASSHMAIGVDVAAKIQSLEAASVATQSLTRTVSERSPIETAHTPANTRGKKTRKTETVWPDMREQGAKGAREQLLYRVEAIQAGVKQNLSEAEWARSPFNGETQQDAQGKIHRLITEAPDDILAELSLIALTNEIEGSADGEAYTSRGLLQGEDAVQLVLQQWSAEWDWGKLAGLHHMENRCNTPHRALCVARKVIERLFSGGDGVMKALTDLASGAWCSMLADWIYKGGAGSQSLNVRAHAVIFGVMSGNHMTTLLVAEQLAQAMLDSDDSDVVVKQGIVVSKVSDIVRVSAMNDAQAAVKSLPDDILLDPTDASRRLMSTVQLLRSSAGRLAFARHGAWLGPEARQRVIGTLNTQYDTDSFCTNVEAEWSTPRDARVAIDDAFELWKETEREGWSEATGRALAPTAASPASP